MKRAKMPASELSSPTKAILEQERKVLLELGNDITRVREKNDLLTLFKQRIKGQFYISHTIVTLIDYKDETYTPFLLDNEGSPIRSHARRYCRQTGLYLFCWKTSWTSRKAPPFSGSIMKKA